MQQGKENQKIEDWLSKVELQMLKKWAELKITERQTRVTNESRNAKPLNIILQYQEIAQHDQRTNPVYDTETEKCFFFP